MINFIKKNKLESALLAIIILLALFLRLYRIADFMTFLGDEGRDVRIVRDLITHGNLVFIGPQTSIGNMYLGPLYYYMMAPALFLSRLNPVGPAIMNALLGTLTVILTYILGRKWFGKWSGLIAALLYAVSPVAIVYSRSSWNPNPMPLFALLCIWGIYEVRQNKKYFWLPLIGVFFAFALQMHYLGLLLAPVLGLYWLLTLLQVKKDPQQRSILTRQTIYAVLLFLLLMSPLVLFDIKHQGMNFNAFKAFFSDRQTTVNLNPARSDRFIPVITGAFQDLVLGRQNFFPGLVAILTGVLYFFAYRRSKNKAPYTLLILWLLLGFLGLGVYKQHVYIHYLGFLYPCFYLILGASLGSFISLRFPRCLPFVLSIIALAGLSLFYSPVRENPNRQLWRTEAAVDLIIKESAGQPFNFGLIAKQNYDESYRFFLENKKANLVRGEVKVVDQLFVICEDGDKCRPEGNPAWQIAVFGPSHIDSQWQIDYLKIYRLVHTK
jgi:4-amino-4-deoxy-L-arabinose transferase-like glycosyltransferase